MKKYGVVNYPIKIIDEKIINALADIEVHHEEGRRITVGILSPVLSTRSTRTW